MGVNATIDYSQELVENLDDLRNLINIYGDMEIFSVKYSFVSDSFHATVIRGINIFQSGIK